MVMRARRLATRSGFSTSRSSTPRMTSLKVLGAAPRLPRPVFFFLGGAGSSLYDLPSPGGVSGTRAWLLAPTRSDRKPSTQA